MRLKIFSRILLVFLVFLVSGLFHTQILQHRAYKIMSEKNRLRVLPLLAPRGTIIDRTGKIIAKDILSFDAAVIHSEIRDREKLVQALAELLDSTTDEVRMTIAKGRTMPYVPYVIRKDIGMQAAIQLEEIITDHPGLILQVSTRRKYFLGKAAGHITGYIGLPTQKELEKLKPYGYEISDYIGRSGVESVCDTYLKGEDGGKDVEVDHRGREVSVLGYKEPVPGKNVYLTIDSDLQEYVSEIFSDRRGAVIAMDPGTGEIRALFSSPSYDPEIFIDRKRQKERVEVMCSGVPVLLDRAVAAKYPPGSVFKLVVASGALEEGKINARTEVVCTGGITIGRRVFGCWEKAGHGVQVLSDALKNSCDVFFYRAGLAIDVEGIAQYASKFGLGNITNIDLPGEVKGVVPDRQMKMLQKKENWYPGDTANFSIGQGFLLATPIEVLRMASVFANNGNLVKPFMIRQIGDLKICPSEPISVGLGANTVDLVREGMRRCVNEQGGTGNNAASPDFVVAGKTGTAQVSGGKTHGWFVAFAPFEKPKLSVVVLDESGGLGGHYAAEIAGKVFKKAKELGLLE
ncbi:MAG: penicillin-binding protein 2 [Candidatus Omnitrophica bacterium]|nr:penicillin-binding protein 2 [Candidatus Omnitrophota bacterium]